MGVMDSTMKETGSRVSNTSIDYEIGDTIQHGAAEDDPDSNHALAQANHSTMNISAKRNADTSWKAVRGDSQEPEYAVMQETVDFSEAHQNGLDSRNSGPGDGITPSNPPARLRAIEVVLSPPSDPESFQHIPLSWTVVRVLEEIEEYDEILYKIEFRDGRIEYAAYDDVIQCKGGRESMRVYQEPRFSFNSTIPVRNSSKRHRSEDDYEESASDFEAYKKHRKRQIFSHTRRSTRQTSRQTSAGLDPEDYDSNDTKYKIIDLVDDDSEDGVEQTVLKGRRSKAPQSTRRITRSRNSTAQKHAVVAESDDELAQNHNRDKDDDTDYDPIPIIRSDIAPHLRRSKKRKRAKPRVSTNNNRPYDSDSSIEFETARRSGRSNKNLKSMRDPEMDEYDAVEEKQTNAPKHVAIKEVFLPVAPDSDFRRMHSDTCESCRVESSGAKNPLVHCQGCSCSYHKSCIGLRAARDHRVTKIGHDDFVFQCKFCIQIYKKKDTRAPDHTVCQVCRVPGISCAEFSSKKTPKQEEKARLDNNGEDPITRVDPLLINNANNILFRCTNCKRGYHFEHLPALTAEVVSDQDLKENRLEEYSMADWNCKDCIDAQHKMHALVAWRPLDQAAYRQGQTNYDYTEDNIEYLIKWTGRSHFHDTWMPGSWVYGVAPGAMRNAFHKRESSTYPKMDIASAVEEEWLLPDVLLNVKYRTRVTTSNKAQDLERINDITSVFVKFQGLSYEEAVWDEPPPRDSGAPWDAFCAAYDEYLNGKYFEMVSDHKMRERIALYRSLDFGRNCELKSQPTQLKQGKLMGYQMEGVNFLLYNFHQQQNVILADEMGLGKTVQIVAFISALTHSKPGCWPFLVVVPNATCSNWRRELKRWAPDLRVVTYHGGRVAQDLAYRHELYPDGPKHGMKAHVVIMSYEAASNVKSVFHGVKWVGLIVDEGQRLKNEETQLYKSLQDMRIPCRILLTGTPLQNNKRELFNLLQFIDTKRNAEDLDAKYAELTKENLPELHNLIRPYFLRRTKAQVLKFLPAMAQIILPVTMTVLQEKLSKSIMARNPELIKAIISRSRVKAGERKSLNNILADLRQCLCHPFCFNGEIEDKTVDMAQMHRNLVEASPKLLLLDIMLPKLKERGHRVLIFSQFLHCLTIIEDFLTGLNMPHARIDGNLSALEKQKRIDAFNAPDSPLFAMLLSTRAGGVGINLATADTVIIYDPDFNPHQDIQALSRAHRIGQKNKVLCFQLVTKNTVEEKIMQMGRKKMALDHALIESMDAKEEVSEDLESILNHGAAALFSNESKDKITYDQASVDKLLDRSQIENTSTGEDHSAETQFSFARIWANDKGDLESNTEDAVDDISPETSTSIWENILKEREKEHERELAARQQVYGRGARRRGTQIDYKTSRVGFIKGVDDVELTLEQPRGADSGGSEIETGDELYIDQNDMEEEDQSEDYGINGETAAGLSKAKSSKASISEVPRHPLQEASIPKTATIPRPKGRPRKSPPFPRKSPPPNPSLLRTPQSQVQQGPTAQYSQPKAASTRFSVSQIPYPKVPSQLPPNNSSNVVMSNPGWANALLTTAPVSATSSTIASASRLSILESQSVRYSSHALPGHPADVQLPSGAIASRGLIGGGQPCALCYRHHATSFPCVDLNSEFSLRVAIDRLRIGGEDPAVAATRDFLTLRLRCVLAKGPARQ